MSGLGVPRTCPNCGSPTEVARVVTGAEGEFPATVDGRWDCSERCYLTDREGFDRALAKWTFSGGAEEL